MSQSYEEARNKSSSNGTVPALRKSSSFLIQERPYFPHVHADPESTLSVVEVASLIIYYPEPPPQSCADHLTATEVKGGITNALFRVHGFPSPHPPSVLIRIFGAEGMIDRDAETHTYAALCEAGIADKYLGRFGNGRVEGWLEGYRPLHNTELKDKMDEIAHRLAVLHATYPAEGEATLWDQLFSWYDQAKKSIQDQTFQTEQHCVKSQSLLKEYRVIDELHRLKEHVIPPHAKVSFCHNDLLAANIMVNDDTGSIQLIDFEYGGVNFRAFDIANHFNEYAGGTDNAKPDYSLFPTHDLRYQFVHTYLDHIHQITNESIDTQQFLEEVDAFVAVNHFYWGLWAINQAADEGCDGFDYLLYAENRFKRYLECSPMSEN